MYFFNDAVIDISNVTIPVHNLKFVLITKLEVTGTNQSIHSRIEGRVQTLTNRKSRDKISGKKPKSIMKI